MKKNSYALLGSAFLTSVAAQAEDATAHAPVSAAAPTSACNFSGFYMVLGLEYSNTKHDFKSIEVVAGAAANLPRNSYAADSITGGIFAGYGKEMGSSRVYLGLEAAYLFASEKSKNLFADLKKKDSLELALRMGVAMNDALPYLKVGFASSKFDVDGKLPRVVAGALVYDLHEKSERLNGFLLGAGIDLKVSRNVMVGLAYTYTMYNDLKNEMLSPDNGITAATAVNHKKYRSKPTSRNAILRIAYTF